MVKWQVFTVSGYPVSFDHWLKLTSWSKSGSE